jgi:dTDP-glucose 4,6-dehydratase/UDP-glucose 4-epimerase
MKVLIIGSQGFIGSNAFSYFTQLGHECWGCGVAEDPENEYYFQVDRYVPDYNNIFKLQKFDVCINASGSPGIGFSIEHPHDDFRMNVNNPYALLNAVRQYNSNCKFINLSSAAVYGNPDALPVKEEDQLHPISPYGYHKMIAEQLVMEFHDVYHLHTCSVRIFSAYGPGIKKQLLWDIYNKALSTQNGYVDLFGKGNETRDFIYITDLLEAIRLIIDYGEFDGETYNLGSATETTIQEVADTFLAIIDAELKTRFNGVQKPGDPLFWKADMSKLQAFGFRATTSITDGLKIYYEWIKLNGSESGNDGA